MGLADFCWCVLMLLLISALGQAYDDADYFDGLYDGYNISQYLVSTGKLGSADASRHGRSFSRQPRRRAFSVGLFGVPDGTTLRFQLQVVRPFASEYTDFLNADDFSTEWYMSLRYKVSDLQATVFRKFQGPGRVNMTAAYHMMNATAQMMQNMPAAAVGYQLMTEDMATMTEDMATMSSAEEQQQGEAAEMAHGQYGSYPERYWTEYGQQGRAAVSWDGYVNRQGEIDNLVGVEPDAELFDAQKQGEIDNRVGVEPDAELFDAQKFRIEQKMNIYERMEQMYNRQGQDGVECVRRAICEVAEAPMEDGVLGDVVNLLLSATSGVEDLLHAKWLDKRYKPYLEAHMYGEMRGDCNQRYAGCALSVLDPSALTFY